ncbi:MAG: response regulator transcription factor [Eubacterium sp.]|nr:response regulator transcription factor [Eubacterium sp.]
MQHILIADDNKDICEVLGNYVVQEGYEPIMVNDGIEAINMFKKCNPAVVLLDIMMPGLDGYGVCKKIREVSDVPIILITAKGEDYERVMGLDIGADDYVVKPFSPSEVMARIRAVQRRIGRAGDDSQKKSMTVDNLTINIDSYNVFIGTEKIPLTKKEVETMWILASNPSKVFTRDNLLDSLWGQDYFGDSRTVDSHIKRLRSKLDKVEHPSWEIKTIWGLGYKFEINLEE